MGRSRARIYTSIWSDEDCLCLSPLAQRMILFLISRPTLHTRASSRSASRRWARGAAGLPPDDERKTLNELADARLV